MKCLVTGGAGFIGSHIVSRLLRDNHEVVVIDNESAEANDSFNWYVSDVENHVEDIRNIEACRKIFKGVEVVFHLAAHSRIQLAMANPFDCVTTNVIGTCNMLELAREVGVSRFINSSTSSSYGLNNQPPLIEFMPTDCLNHYSASKVSAEKFCYMYYRLHKLRTVSLRYFNVYGPRQPLKGPYAPVIGLFQEQKRRGEPMTIVGDGEQRRDFTHVDDVVEANICAMNNLISIESINIGTGTNYSMNQVADMIGGDRVYIPARKGESRETLADISRAKSMLGWEPKITLEDQLTNHDQL